MSTLFPLAAIIYDDSTRQRKDLREIEALASSIERVGLMNPPTITRDGVLIQGRRRVAAMKDVLGWLEGPVNFSDEIDPARLHLMELEENVKRVDLTWQEQVRAISDYYALRKDEAGWNQTVAAQELSISPARLSEALAMTRVEALAPDLRVMEAGEYSTARGLVKRYDDRRKDEGLAGFGLSSLTLKDEDVDAGKPLPPPTRAIPLHGPTPSVTSIKAGVFNADFLEWSKTPPTKFNFLHCDFPYGVSVGDKDGQSSSKRLGSYDDGEDVYWRLLDGLAASMDNLVAESAHLLFWFSMKHFAETHSRLTAMGWKIDPFPWIWHKSDNAGIIPDSNRGGRRTYETAFFGSRGDRKIIKPLAISVAAQTPRNLHTSEKSSEALSHFFRMIVDDSTVMLDPTCGSGNAVRVSQSAGAKFSVGLEIDPEFAAVAKRNVLGA